MFYEANIFLLAVIAESCVCISYRFFNILAIITKNNTRIDKFGAWLDLLGHVACLLNITQKIDIVCQVSRYSMNSNKRFSLPFYTFHIIA